MSFFQDIDGNSILERNSSRLEGIEINEARKLVKQYKIARNELKLQLLMTPDNTFTGAKLNQALAQVEMGLNTLSRRLKPQLSEGFGFLTEQGIEDSVKEINHFDKLFKTGSVMLPLDQILLSTEPENLLFNQYESSINSYNQNIRTKLQHGLTQSLLQNKSWTQAVDDFGGLFDSDEWVLARIVRTELHGIYNNSKINGYSIIKDQYLPDLKKTMYHPMDSRTGMDSIEMDMAKLVVDIDKPFEFTYKGKKQVFMNPPNRPNDRAILIPYRSAWDN